METIYKISNLHKSYRSSSEVIQAAVDINLEIKKGDFVIIFGPSGSGKTSLLNLLSGLDQPDSGEIVFRGKNFGSLSDKEKTLLRRDQIGMVFQSFELIPVMNCYENIEYPLLLGKMGKKERKKRISEISHSLEIADLLHRRPCDISGGQKQRVAIARTLVTRPQIILGDELTGSLDSKTSRLIYEMLKDLNETRHQSLITVSHDRSLQCYASRVFNLIDGNLIAQ